MRLACVSASLRMVVARRSLAAASSSIRLRRFCWSAALALTCSSCMSWHPQLSQQAKSPW